MAVCVCAWSNPYSKYAQERTVVVISHEATLVEGGVTASTLAGTAVLSSERGFPVRAASSTTALLNSCISVAKLALSCWRPPWDAWAALAGYSLVGSGPNECDNMLCPASNRDVRSGLTHSGA